MDPFDSGELSAIPRLSLYIHIPFCLKKCDYCDFYSIEERSPGFIRKVLKASCEQAADLLESTGYPSIESLYIGGGTPSSLPPEILEEFLSDLYKIMPRNAMERTIEANPESCSPEFLSLVEDFGINRLSLGIQTLDERLLTVLELYLLWGSKYNKEKAYFYNYPWKEENLESLDKAEALFEYSLIYWDEALRWSEKAWQLPYHLEQIQNWEDENYRIQTGDLDYADIIGEHLERLRSVRADFLEMDENTY